MTKQETSARTGDLPVTGFINAGGPGTRLMPIFPAGSHGVCKALLPVGTLPVTFVEHQINKLLTAGACRIVVDVGSHANAHEYVATKYAEYPQVTPVRYEQSLESGGGLLRTVQAHPEWFEGPILACCVDTILDLDETQFLDHHQRHGGAITVAVTTLADVPNYDAYRIGDDERVIYCGEIDPPGLPSQTGHVLAASCTGAVIIEPEYLANIDWHPGDGAFSFYRSNLVLGAAIRERKVFAYNNEGRLFLDTGTPERWQRLVSHQEIITPFIHRNPPGGAR